MCILGIRIFPHVFPPIKLMQTDVWKQRKQTEGLVPEFPVEAWQQI